MRPRTIFESLSRRAYWRSLSEPQLFVGSFLLLIALGTLGFLLLPGLYAGAPLTFLDALFTATSAVCVTGLIVVDTATFFTPFGQAYILFLIQLGGLGIITFTTLIITALGLRLSLRQEGIARVAVRPAPHLDHRRLTRHVVTFTLLMEAAGAALLYLFWIPSYGFAGAAWPALFHSISAFCNAGFSIFSDSLVGFTDRPAILTIIMALIVLGGLGFLVIEEIYLLRKSVKRGNTFRLSLHSRIVLVTTGVLIVGGWILFSTFEWNVSFAALGTFDKLMNGLFLSVTSRTAGFNTIDYATAANNTDFLTILLMTIGGSPGSMAGGMKTTTFAIIGLLAWSRMRGLPVLSLANRSVPDETVQRAVGVFVLVFSLTTAAIFIFTSTELGWIDYTDSAGFLPFMFEAASAFNTVGLSMGVTPELSTAGRLTAIALMFVGRVGPLTFAATLARRHASHASFHYAYENVGLG